MGSWDFVGFNPQNPDHPTTYNSHGKTPWSIFGLIFSSDSSSFANLF